MIEGEVLTRVLKEHNFLPFLSLRIWETKCELRFYVPTTVKRDQSTNQMLLQKENVRNPTVVKLYSV